ncbi:MAG: DUF1207 domain-containing protein [Methylococcales bacterium]|nr:DUF1207 domain-containing protein [Methylococcales bacterium]MDP3010343.1 DUF1207 domain-containing protein [Methylococcales bacterium]
MNYYRVLTTLGVMLSSVSSAYATPHDDTYIAGYAAGVLKQNLKLDTRTLTVKNGVIFLPVGSVASADEGKVVQMLSEIPGVNAVKIADASNPAFATTSDEEAARPPNDQNLSQNGTAVLPNGLLPRGHLFKPLIADPRWAHFSVAYRNYQSNNFDGRNIASVSFGETIPFYRTNIGNSLAQIETGIQGGVFSDFNLGAPSADLLNTDFIASLYSSVRAGQFSAFGRVYHQSSHLGDEFLLRMENTKFQRVNLSYEGADLKLSYELPYGVRIYGGGGGIFHKEPSNLKTWSAQSGIEFRSPWRIDFASMRPIAAVDIKNFEENNWSTDVSARAGVEFEQLQVLSRKLQLMAEYYNGFTPSGQFYKSKVEYLGLGLHYHF